MLTNELNTGSVVKFEIADIALSDNNGDDFLSFADELGIFK